MKKILILNNNLHIGGVQKALVNLLCEVHDQYEITLALFYPHGELLKNIPEDVTILPIQSCYRYLGMSKNDCSNFWEFLCRSFFAAISRLFGRKYAIWLMGFGQKTLEGYDVAISYLHNSKEKAFYGGCNDFLLRHVSAPKKITCLHGDYQLCGANTKENAVQYAQFDFITACSQGCADSFLQANPMLKGKMRVLPNCQDFEKIRQDAEKMPVSWKDGKLHIVTIARMGKEKGVPRAVEAFGALEEFRDKYHYTIIGDGVERPVVEEKIRQYGLEDQITLMGEMANPYGYLKASDLLLIPSVSEAAPMVIGEAVCLGTPILSTRTSSAEEMIAAPGYGWVCENNVKGLVGALAEIFKNSTEIAEKKQNISRIEMDNALAVSMFSKLLNE